MEIKNIVFDFGGVLIDWNPEYLFRDAFKNEEEFVFFLNQVCNADWNQKQDKGRLFADGVAELTIKFPQYKTEIENYYTHWIKMIGGEIVENTSLIKDLKKKHKLYGLTNWSSETFPLVYEKYSFFKELDGIIVSGREKMIKPNRNIYELLLSRHDILPEESLFIDDNEANITAAKEMGFQVIHYKNSMDLKSELKKFI